MDQTAIAFLGLVAVYIFLPIGPDIYVRLLGGRQLASFILIFLAARHLGMSSLMTRGLEVAILAAGAIVAAIGLWNYFRPGDFAIWISSTGACQSHTAVLRDAGPQGVVIFHSIAARPVV